MEAARKTRELDEASAITRLGSECSQEGSLLP